jgi:hypothetical protein
MERLDGPTLEQFLAANGRPATIEAIDILPKTAAALDPALSCSGRDAKAGGLAKEAGEPHPSCSPRCGRTGSGPGH